MPKIKYQSLRIGAEALKVIVQANRILEEFEAQGFDLTLRQLYYQFVAKALIANKESEYKKLGDIINRGRLAGLIDWDHIVDRTRAVRANSHWHNPTEILLSAANSFALDKWKTQKYRIEVWVEKDALVGVIGRVCQELDVPYFSCRGYTSQSEMWAGAMRLKDHEENDQETVILHLGDHDPSGLDMSRDIEERLDLFMGGVAHFRRIALNMDQIEEFQPPPNPAKVTDSRFSEYQLQYGDESWELDALNPAIINGLIRDAIMSYRDVRAWAKISKEEKRHKNALHWTVKNWRTVEALKRKK